jgi:hypothetical protein
MAYLGHYSHAPARRLSGEDRPRQPLTGEEFQPNYFAPEIIAEICEQVADAPE